MNMSVAPINIAIEGTAAIGSFGFGRGALFRAMATPPAREILEGFSVLPKADVSILTSYVQPRALRQVDHFTRMALTGAFAALEDARIEPGEMKDAGLVLASGYGPAQMTFSFLDSIEDHGPNMASPLSFSFSVHNIPAANIALKLGMAGPCTTVCQFESSVTSALLTAASWLLEGRVSRVLLGAVDELTPILAAITARITNGAAMPTPGVNARYERRDLPLGEGAAFFCLSLDTSKAKALIDSIALHATVEPDRGVFEADAVYHSGSLNNLPEDIRREALRRSSAYGNLPVAQAFDMFAAVAAFEEGKDRKIACVSSSPAGAVGSVMLSSASMTGR